VVAARTANRELEESVQSIGSVIWLGQDSNKEQALNVKFRVQEAREKHPKP